MWFSDLCGSCGCPPGGPPPVVAKSARCPAQAGAGPAGRRVVLHRRGTRRRPRRRDGRVTLLKRKGVRGMQDVAVAPDGSAWFARRQVHPLARERGRDAHDAATAIPAWHVGFDPRAGCGSPAARGCSTARLDAAAGATTRRRGAHRPRPVEAVSLATLRRQGGFKITVARAVRDRGTWSTAMPTRASPASGRRHRARRPHRPLPPGARLLRRSRATAATADGSRRRRDREGNCRARVPSCASSHDRSTALRVLLALALAAPAHAGEVGRDRRSTGSMSTAGRRPRGRRVDDDLAARRIPAYRGHSVRRGPPGAPATIVKGGVRGARRRPRRAGLGLDAT